MPEIMNQMLRFPEPIDPRGGKVEAIGPGGRRYELTLTPSDVHTSSDLTEFLAGYKPFGFRADDVSPVVFVDKPIFYHRIFGSDDAFLHVETRGSLTSPPKLIDPSSTATQAKTEVYNVGSMVPVQTEDAADNYSPKQQAGKRCMNAILLDREVIVMALIGLNTSWASAVRYTLGGTENWDGGVDADPLAEVQAAVRGSMQQATQIIMNQKVNDYFLASDTIKDHMRQMLGDKGLNFNSMTDYQIPGLPPVKVVTSQYRSASGGALSYTLGNHCVVMSTPPGIPTDGEEVAASYTFRERGDDGNGINVREWFVEGAGVKGAYMINVTMAEKSVITGNACGGHIASCTS